MYKFGKKSKEILNECHKDLQIICNELIKIMDVTVLCGHRNKEAQNKAYAEGRSQLKYPLSKHNKFPSMAIDLAPYPIDWNDIERFEYMCGLIKGIAHEKGIKIIQGKNFSFKDYPHLELYEE
jgi:peptidoglycan L-alanyl-D-glutamate endopeptidase CwlK